MAKRRIIKKVTTTTTKSTIVIGGRRAPIAHKAYKGNASNQNRTNRNTMISNCARMVRHSTRIPKKITRFTESIPGRDIPKKSIKTRKILEQHQRKQPQNKKQHKLAIPKKDIVIAKKAKAPQSPSSRASLKRPPSDVDHSLRTAKPPPGNPPKKKRKNNQLIPRTDIEDMAANSYFYGKSLPKFVSVRTYHRMAHRFVLTKDIEGLKKVAADKAHFDGNSLLRPYSCASNLTPQAEAVLTEDFEFIDEVFELSDRLQSNRDFSSGRAPSERVLLKTVSTGEQNQYMLGHATAKIEMTRGGREGNNALLNHDADDYFALGTQVKTLIEKNVSFRTMEYIASHKYSSGLVGYYRDLITVAVRFGNRKLAGHLIKTYSQYSFNELHIETLLNDDQPLTKFKPISTVKKAQTNDSITPIHTAAINPNASYLEEILSVFRQNFDIPDRCNWYPIHYAAVCEGSGPLKLLLERNTPVTFLTKYNELPLHCAARAGRADNVKILLEAIHNNQQQQVANQLASRPETAESRQEYAELERYLHGSGRGRHSNKQKAPRTVKLKGKASMVNAKNKKGLSALHIAAERGHQEVIEVLLSDPDTKVNLQTSAAGGSVTALMIACRMGFRSIADVLIDDGGAMVEKGDKFKRTALTHAIICGQNHIVAMLLRRGASPCEADSSGNTPAHYAAAYGWLDCLEMLAKVDASCLGKNNDWHLTPLAVAYLKGHLGIFDWLIDGPYCGQVSVNCCDQNGTSLLSSVIDGYSEISSKDILKQISYLIAKGADCSLKDTAMNSALHVFAGKIAILKITGNTRTDFDVQSNEARLTKEEYLRCVDLLLENGARIFDRNEPGMDAFNLALKANNLLLTEYLLDKMFNEGLDMSALCDETTSNSDKCGNILHSLIKLPFKVMKEPQRWAGRCGPSGGQYNIIPLLKRFISIDSAQMVTWLNEKNNKGFTPVTLLCKLYTEVSVNVYMCNAEHNEHKTCYVNCEQFLYTMCAVLRTLVSLDSRVLLHSLGESSADETKQDNNIRKEGCNERVIFYGLIGNSVHRRTAATFTSQNVEYKITNKLLTSIIECAKQANILEELLRQRNNNDETPLLHTVMQGDAETSLYLMRQGVYLDNDKIERQWSLNTYVPLKKSVMICALEKRLFVILRELNLSREQWNSCTADGNNAFHYAARMQSAESIEYFEFLKGKGVELKPNDRGIYPLHIAVDAVRGQGSDVLTEPLEWFIQNKTGINSQDSRGRLPLHFAFAGSHEDIADEASSTIDPIAVVSIIEQAMDKSMLDVADNDGNTALHYAARCGANVCMVTLLRYGCNPNQANKAGNTPLCYAVQNNHESCTLTLIQAKSDVVVPITTQKEPPSLIDEPWVWIPNRRKPKKPTPKTSITSIVVRNDWQGIIYMILDILGNNERTLAELLTAALQHRAYNLGLGLLRMLTKAIHTDEERSAAKLKTVNSLNIFEVFVKHISGGTLDGNVKKVFDELLSAGLKWYAEDENGTLRSRAVEYLAQHGSFEILNALKEWDAKHTDSQSALVHFTYDNDNPLVGVIEHWIRFGPSEGAKTWLRIFADKFGANTLMRYERPAFDGLVPWLGNRPEPAFTRMTPLIRAIQAKCVTLVKFLVQERVLKTNLNQPDENGLTPLMHACMVNDDQIVRLLFNSKCSIITQSIDAPPAQQTPQQNIFDISNRNFIRPRGFLAGAPSFPRPLFGAQGMSSEEEEPMNPATPSTSNTNCTGKMDPLKLTNELDLKRTVIWDVPSDGDYKSGDFHDCNFLHFMLKPCAWENVDLLEAICNAVPSVVSMLNPTGSRSETPLMTARRLRQKRMVCAMQRLCRASNVPVEIPAVDISNIMVQYDVKADSERFLARDTEAKAEAIKRDRANALLKPHRNSGYERTGEICTTKFDGSDEEVLYKVMLTKTDLSYGLYGFHNYYRMELIKRKGSDLHILFTNWGRIGDANGQYQRTPFGSLAAGHDEFCSVFRSKTGNDFTNIANFEEKPNKYRLVTADPNAAIDFSDLTIELDTDQTQALMDIDSVYKFIRDVSNVARLQEKTRSLSSYSRMRVPFGRISRVDILEARKVLQKLASLQEELDKKRNDKADVEEIHKVYRKQTETSNQFYRLMPLGGFENGLLPVIDSEDIVKNYEQMLSELLDFETAGQIITAAAEMRSSIDPYLYILNAIECELTLMDHECIMSQRILQYIQNSSKSCRVQAIYRVKSKEATQLFNENALQKPNHRYLWHGTKPENILSILKHGLLVTPVSAQLTGQCFGKGIYFADMFAKSEAYCTSSAAHLKYVFLCQVALGKCLTETDNVQDISAEANFDTLHVIGCEHPDPHYDITLDDGAVLPLGPILNYNYSDFHDKFGYYNRVQRSEYIVKDRSMVTIKYIVASYDHDQAYC